MQSATQRPDEPHEQSEVTDEVATTATLARVGSSARNAAAGAGQSIAVGISALKKVRQASKMRSDAEAYMREIERGLAEDYDELTHREDVEQNYDQIVYTQTTEIESAQSEIANAEARMEQQRAEATRLTSELRQMREQHEQELRPYRNLMDSTRGRSDDAAKSLAAIRRDVRAAERAMAEATKDRDAKISAAHRAVDTAQERVTALETELGSLGMDGEAASPDAMAHMESELASNRATLATARNDVVQITQQAQDAVDQAQRKLLTLQRDQAQAERLAESTKTEATTRKDEYDRMYREAQTQERKHEELIKGCEGRIRELTQTRNDAQARLTDAQDMLDEANEIHAHPETTEGLRERIADEEADLEDARAELEELCESERELRRSTRTARLVVITIALVVVLLIALGVWFFVRG